MTRTQYEEMWTDPRQVMLKDKSAYWLRPSFVLSYMAGTVDEVQHALLLAS